MAIEIKYEFGDIEEKLVKAISILQENDKIFLDKEFDINERTVTHRLGIYLAGLFNGLDVDCEYNRQYDEATDEYISKNVDLPKIKEGEVLKDIEARTVFPDIIVHKRTTSFNLLAIEVKMGWKNSKGLFDEVKAEAYKRTLGYQYSAFVIIGPNENFKIKWV